ncbi:hypothetical protein C3L33_16988, partial [Rhododendron williamsianum]
MSTELTNSPTAAERAVLMDLDLDLDGPWQFDQIFFVPSSDQPRSPLLDCSEDRDDEPAGNSAAPRGGSTRLFYNSREVFCNLDSVTGSLPRIGDKRRLPPPSVGLTPLNYPDWSCVIKERMAQALRYFKESTEQHVLAQVWAPVKRGDRYVLTTSGQPFVLDPRTNGLHQYRMVSLMYMFSVDGEDGGALGLPGRVFQKKLPEWTPNVQYYSSKEYPRLTHALVHNVQGSLALPVFEPSGESCVGVLELIMTSPKINYAPEVDKVCKALEVGFSSSYYIYVQFHVMIITDPLTDILVLFRFACLDYLLIKTFQASTVFIISVSLQAVNLRSSEILDFQPHRHRSVLAIGGGLKKSCSSFDGSCMGKSMNLSEAFAAKIEPLIKILNFYSLSYYNEANMSAAWDLSLAISQGAGGEFKLASLAASSLPVAASSNVPNRQNAAGSKPPNLREEKHVSMTPNESGSQHHEGSSPSKSGSGLREESCGTPTSMAHPSVSPA